MPKTKRSEVLVSRCITLLRAKLRLLTYKHPRIEEERVFNALIEELLDCIPHIHKQLTTGTTKRLRDND